MGHEENKSHENEGLQNQNGGLRGVLLDKDPQDLNKRTQKGRFGIGKEIDSLGQLKSGKRLVAVARFTTLVLAASELF